ncbi:carbohydrate kinase family protein [Tunturiibacter gelidoferens]|uniref:Sugar/nucleoside kinase (Ribokinase family) n=1 Tax=Tunturiibacter lichenicola TaxID=2051959 RepID=A0A7Y9T754_9BACT|nr:carbohydrate kinase family protein [Edaphobacter lichenicola]NYF54029.1 sugar/nucleoside kinase (ribokinase family) [Edaphobacter lichenicola]
MLTRPRGEHQRRFDITIAGETNLDLILYGLPEQMSTERELLGSGFKVTLGGSSSILAHNLAALGGRVGFISQVGRDEMGDIALARLGESGVDLSHITSREDVGTGVTVLLPHGQRRHILTYLGAMAEMTIADLDLAYLTSSRHFHLSSLFLQTGLQPDLPELFDQLKKAGLTLSLDTNDDPNDTWGGVLDQLLDRIDVLLPNEDEILRIARKPTLEESLDSLAPRVPLIVVKCGARGAVVQQGKKRDWVPSLRVEPVDTIGAGDSFNAGFLNFYLKDENPLRAAAMGNVTGALSTLRPGGTEAYRDSAFRDGFLNQYTVA